MAGEHEDVYCTLLMSDSYLPGACVLAHSLRDSGTTKKLAILITTDTLLEATLRELHTVYDYIIPVDRIATSNIDNLVRLDRLDLRFAFTKIALWRQVQFRKIVYLDADVVALRAPDELFDLDVDFAAAPDIGWPDCFNSGVMLLKPSMSDYSSLQTLAASGASFDGADQGLLNGYYADKPWHRLSFTYNCTPSSSYQYEPAYRQFRSSINMVHFIGKDKPWYQGRQAIDQQSSGVYKELLGTWWAVYDRHYKIPQTSAMGQLKPAAKNVNQYVRGEQTQSAFGWAASGAPPQSFEGSSSSYTASAGFAAPGFSAPTPALPPQLPTYKRLGPPETTPPQIPSEPPLSLASAGDSSNTTGQPSEEAGHPGGKNTESSGQHDILPPPPPTTERQRRFSAPKSEWDATRFEPPSISKPEAQSFPSDHYEMSQETHLFSPPKAYPEPPKDMWYKVPEIKPAIYEKPKPIFPWESGEGAKARPAPTRVFAEDYPPEPEPESAPETLQEPQPEVVDPGNVINSGISAPSAASEVSAPAPEPWQAFTRTNAWDDDVSIDRYVRALKKSQARRGNIQVLHHTANENTTSESQGSATDSSGTVTPPQGRRESIRLTDFPSEIERPSLPVTPAPLRRTNFWSTDKDGGEPAEQLVAAEGVPEQKDWVCPNCGYTCNLPSLSLSTTGASVSAVSSVRASTSKRESVAMPKQDFFERPFSPFSVSTNQARPRSFGGRASPHLNQGRTTFAPAADFFKKDPSERLEELRRSSIVATADLSTMTTSDTKIPTRQFPESAKSVRPIEFRNLEESFSGARTQERIEGASSDLARGVDPDNEGGQVKITQEETANSRKAWNTGFGLFNQDEASEEMQEPIGEPVKEKTEEAGGLAIRESSREKTVEDQMKQGETIVKKESSNFLSDLPGQQESSENDITGVEQSIPGSFPEEEDETILGKAEPVGTEPSMPGSFPDEEGTSDVSKDVPQVSTEQEVFGSSTSKAVGLEQGVSGASSNKLETSRDASKIDTENASSDNVITEPTIKEKPQETETEQNLPAAPIAEDFTSDARQVTSETGLGQGESNLSRLEGTASDASLEVSRVAAEKSAASESKLGAETGDVSRDISAIGAQRSIFDVPVDEPKTTAVSRDTLPAANAYGGSSVEKPASEVSKDIQQSGSESLYNSSTIEKEQSEVSREVPQMETEQISGSTFEGTTGKVSEDFSHPGTGQIGSSTFAEPAGSTFEEQSQTDVEQTVGSSLDGTTTNISKDSSEIGAEKASGSLIEGITTTSIPKEASFSDDEEIKNSVSQDLSQGDARQSAVEGATSSGIYKGVSKADIEPRSGSSLEETTIGDSKGVSSIETEPGSSYNFGEKPGETSEFGTQQAYDSTSKSTTSDVTDNVLQPSPQPTSASTVEVEKDDASQQPYQSGTRPSTTDSSTVDRKVFELSQGFIGTDTQQGTSTSSTVKGETSGSSQTAYGYDKGLSASDKSTVDEKAVGSFQGLSDNSAQRSSTTRSGFDGTTSDVPQGLSSQFDEESNKTGDVTFGQRAIESPQGLSDTSKQQRTTIGSTFVGTTGDVSQGLSSQLGTGLSTFGGSTSYENVRSGSPGVQTTYTSNTLGGRTGDVSQNLYRSGSGLSTSGGYTFDAKTDDLSRGLQTTSFGPTSGRGGSGTAQGPFRLGTFLRTSEISTLDDTTGGLPQGLQKTSIGSASGEQTTYLPQGSYQSIVGSSGTGGLRDETTRDISGGVQSTSSSGFAGVGRSSGSWQGSFQAPTFTQGVSQSQYIEQLPSVSAARSTTSSTQISRSGSAQISRSGSPITIVKYTPTGIVTETYDQSSFVSTDRASENQAWKHTSSSSSQERSTAATTAATATTSTTAAAGTTLTGSSQARPDFFHRITASQWAFDVDPNRAETGEIVGTATPASMLSGMRQAVKEATVGKTLPSFEAESSTSTSTLTSRVQKSTATTTTSSSSSRTKTVTSSSGLQAQRQGRPKGSDMDEYDIA